MNAEILKSLFPKSQIASFIPYVDEAFLYAELNTPERQAMFLAQVGHECQGFTRFVENLNYSAEALARTWPTRYALNPKSKGKKIPNPLAGKIARQPKLIADYTYSNRVGNGDVMTGDGWRYRGRGPMMLTFKDNYSNVDKKLSLAGQLVAEPDLLLHPHYGIMSAAVFWSDRNVNAAVEKDMKDPKSIATHTRKYINGGIIGLAKVESLYKQIIQIV